MYWPFDVGYDVGDGEVIEKAKPLIERVLGCRRVTDKDSDTVALETRADSSWDMEMPSDAESDDRFVGHGNVLRFFITQSFASPHTPEIDLSFDNLFDLQTCISFMYPHPTHPPPPPPPLHSTPLHSTSSRHIRSSVLNTT